MSDRAWDDLSIPTPARGELVALRDRHPILEKFFTEYADATRVDRGKPIQSVSDPKVFRIRERDFRAAVRYDETIGVVWLCRVLRIADFSSEPELYRRFGEFEGNPHSNPPKPAVLLPREDERMRAAGEQYLEGVIAALCEARDRAFEDPNSWKTATMRPAATSKTVDVGRAYAEREKLSGGGEYATRYIVVLQDFPRHLELPGDWRARVIAECFPTDEPVEPAFHALPAGTNRRHGEIPLIQRRLEG